MSGIRIVLDTNIVIEIFAGNKKLSKRLEASQKLLIPSIVLGELYVGINRVKNRSKHLQTLHSFLSITEIIPVDDDTAKIYGEIVAALFKKGKPIPTNDVWIAALAKQHQLTLVSRDHHFEEIEGLLLEKW